MAAARSWVRGHMTMSQALLGPSSHKLSAGRGGKVEPHSSSALLRQLLALASFVWIVSPWMSALLWQWRPQAAPF